MSHSGYAHLSISAKSNAIVSYKPVKFTYLRDGFLKDFLDNKLQPKAVLFVAQKDQKGAKDKFNFLKGDTIFMKGEGDKRHFQGSMPFLNSTCGREAFTGKVKVSDVILKPRTDWSAEDVCEYIIKPLCMEEELFYSDLIKRVDSKLVGAKDYGKGEVPAAFVSYARLMRFVDWVDALESFFKDSSNNIDVDAVYVWSDLFCANQPKLTKKDLPPLHVDFLTRGLQMAIQRFQYKVLIFDMWNDPTPTKRAWCIWEIFGVALDGGELSIAMTEAEKDKYLQALMSPKEFGKIMQTLVDIDAKKSECFNKKDKEMIFDAIKQQASFFKVNEVVLGKLRQLHVEIALQEVERRRQRGLTETSEFPDLLDNVGKLLRNQGKFDEALAMHYEALEIEKRGKNRPGKVYSLVNISHILKEQGKLDAAEKMYREALELYERLIGKKDADYATILCDLSSLLKAQGKLVDAEKITREVLEMDEKLMGKEHPDYALNLNNLAELLRAQGNFMEAEPLYKEAICLFKSINRDEAAAGSLTNLASLFSSQGRWEKAKLLYQEAIDITRRVYGNQHPIVATALNNLGFLLNEQGKLHQAEQLMREVLGVLEIIYGKDHSKYALTLNNLARVLSAQGKYVESEQQFKQALEIRRAVLGNEHFYTASSLEAFAQSLCDQGRYDEAMPLIKEALEIDETALGKEHIRYALDLCTFGRVFSGKGDFDQANDHFAKALSIRTIKLGEQHADVARTRWRWAQSKKSEGDDEESKRLWNQACQLMKEKLGEAHPDYVQCKELWA